MKINKILKLVLIILITINFVSCSSDDNSTQQEQDVTSEVKMTYNGAELVFDNIVVETGANFRKISATIGTNTSRLLIITIDKNTTGGNAFLSFRYSHDGIDYQNYQINGIVNKHTDSEIKANFSGTMTDYDSQGEEIIATITTGSISLSNYINK